MNIHFPFCKVIMWRLACYSCFISPDIGRQIVAMEYTAFPGSTLLGSAVESALVYR